MILKREKLMQTESVYNSYNFNFDWKFYQPSEDIWPLVTAVTNHKDANGSEFFAVDFDDSKWQQVSLPHTFNDVDSFDDVARDAGEGVLYRGITFYRKKFIIEQEVANDKVFIEFEGVRQAAYVYLNGELIGYYEAGVAPFGFDLTHKIRFGEENVIAIALDNTSSRDLSEFIRETKPGTKPGSNSGVDFQWNTKDFNPIMGGLTRNVILHIKPNIYQTLPLYSNLRTKGIYVYATDFDLPGKTATITVESEVRNESGSAQQLSLSVVVVDSKGRQVAEFDSASELVSAAKDLEFDPPSIVPADAYDVNPAPTQMESKESTVLQAVARIGELDFWSPDQPNLYDVYSILKGGDQVLDVEKITTGFRKLEVRGGMDGGVFINDQYEWLTGYAQRASSEWAVIGIAPDWIHDYDASLVKESNANFIRWMHIAAQPADIRAGDKYGIVSVQPAGDKEREPSGRQWAQRVETMRDVVIYFRNSPSIMFWEAGNAAVSTDKVKEMVDLRKKLDAHGRPMGCRSLETPDAVEASEWVGTMLGRRVRDGKSYTPQGELIRDQRALVETEYSRDESPRRVWDDFSPPDFDYLNLFTGANGAKENYKDAWDLTAEDFVVRHTEAYFEFYSRRMQANSPTPYYSAAAAMVWSDSNMHGRMQATENCRVSGRVDPVRIKKQSFYAFQTMQSKQPALYLVGHWNYPTDPQSYRYLIKDPITQRYTGETGLRDAANKTVYVIGSDHISKVELYINGQLHSVDSEAQDVFLYQFDNVNIMQTGFIEAIGYDANGKQVATHKIETVSKAVGIKLTPVTGPEGLRADGSDIAFVDIEVVDSAGKVHPLDFERIDLSLAGPGELLGGYNSGIRDLGHAPNYTYAECGVNRVFIRSTRTAGPITLRAYRDGLPTAIITIDAKDVDTGKNGLALIEQQTMGPNSASNAAMQAILDIKADGKACSGSDSDLAVYVNGNLVEFPPGLNAYRSVGVYGPAFPVLNQLGVEYEFDEHNGKLTVKHNSYVVETTIADSDMYVNKIPGTINDWPEMIEDVLHIEISAVLPALGFDCWWSQDKKSYYIV